MSARETCTVLKTEQILRLERKHVTDEILAVTPYQTDDYHEIDWQAALKDDEVAVVHILAVNPHFRNHGCAKAMMRKVISLADSKGLKAVRLDAPLNASYPIVVSVFGAVRRYLVFRL